MWNGWDKSSLHTKYEEVGGKSCQEMILIMIMTLMSAKLKYHYKWISTSQE